VAQILNIATDYGKGKLSRQLLELVEEQSEKFVAKIPHREMFITSKGTNEDDPQPIFKQLENQRILKMNNNEKFKEELSKQFENLLNRIMRE
jgi:superfamily II helicase